MDKKNLKLKIFLNFYGTSTKLQNVCLKHTTIVPKKFCYMQDFSFEEETQSNI